MIISYISVLGVAFMPGATRAFRPPLLGPPLRAPEATSPSVSILTHQFPERRAWSKHALCSAYQPFDRRSRTRLGLGTLASEQLMIPPPEKILAAVEKAGGRVTVQDVAALAGEDLAVAQKGLVKLAALVEGDLEVGKDGDLVYNFPRNFRTALRTRSFTQQAKELWLKLWPSLFYVTRVSFGLCLILSIVLVFATIAFAGSATQGGDREDDRRRDRGGFGGGMGMYFGPSPFDFFYYRPYGYYYATGSQGRGREGEPAEMGFLESCFSYIFGDGDPNAGLEEERYREIAGVIRRNGGAVVAEQLAPYLDVPAPPDPTAYATGGGGALTAVVDESFVLPILTRLNGRPEVTSEGDIIYVFPEFMTSAVEEGRERGREALDAGWARQVRVDEEVRQYQGLSASEIRQALLAKRVPVQDCFDKASLLERLKGFLLSAPSTAQALGEAPYLSEQPVPFSLAPTTNRVFAGILGVANLGGAIVLGDILSKYSAMYGSTGLPGLLGLSQALYPALIVYAVGFNLIPFLRSRWLNLKNAEIARRNEARQSWAGILGRAVGPLYEKILAARHYRSNLKVIKKEDVLYTSGKSVAEQSNREVGDLQAFDRQMEERERGGRTLL